MAWDTNTVGTTYTKPGYGQAKAMWEQGVGNGIYQGQRVAGFNGQQNDYFKQVGENFGSTPGYLQSGMNTVGDVAQSNGVNGDIRFNLDELQNIAGGNNVNPYFQDNLNNQLDDIQSRVNASMSGAGRYGSGAHTDVLTNELGNVSTAALNDHWNANQALKMGALQTGLQGGLSAQGQGLQASALAPTMLQGDITRLNELMKSGAIQQSQKQDELNAARELWEQTENNDWNFLQKYLGTTGMGSPVGAVQSQPAQQPKPSTAQNILGGALTGAGIGGMFGSPLLGAVGGGALGLFG